MFYVIKLILYTDALRAFGEHGFNGCPAGVLFEQKNPCCRRHAKRSVRSVYRAP